MKKVIKEFLQKTIKLWQSNNREYENVKIGGILFFGFGFVFLVLSYFMVNENILITNIAKYTFLYFAILVFCVAIDFFLIYFYVYNDLNHFKRSAKYFLVPLIILLTATLIIGIPFIVILGIISKILNFRAKKMDNLISFMLYSVITVIVISVFIYPDYILAYFISNYTKYILLIKCNFNIGVYPVGLFIFISLLKLEVNTFFYGLLFINQNIQDKSIKKRLKAIENKFDKNISYSDFDIKAHVQNKSEILKVAKDKMKYEISYDVTYLKNTLRKVELALLILFFIIVVLKILPKESLEYLDKYQSDTINVLTIYTLIMLYLDKRKEWK